MMEETDRCSALLDFLAQYEIDAAAGLCTSLEFYLERFPEIETSVRVEYERLQAESAFPPSPTRGSSPSERLDGPGLIEHLRGQKTTPARYCRGDEIGRGGMSRVYRARDVELDRELAMKVHQAARPGTLRRFVREARVLARLDHPGVVPIHELGLDAEGRLYFTMRLVRGRSLRENFLVLHDRPGPGARRDALEAVLRVCDTMAYAHSQGVIHRDLKPSNVMLGRFGEVYVVDWGLARLFVRAADEDNSGDPIREQAAAVETLAGDVLGTPGYMAPEQARGAPGEVGPRSDIYSIGAILYHLLAGHAPFHDRGATPSSTEVLARVLEGPPAALAHTGSTVYPELVSICERAMARSALERYATCAEMAADLRAFLDGRVVRAHERGLVARARKWVRRNRLLSVALTGALVLGMGALVSWSEAQAKEKSLSLLADLRGPLELLDEFPTLWPAVPEKRSAIEQWIARAERLQEHARECQLQLEGIRARSKRVDDSEWVRADYVARREQHIAAAVKARDETKGKLDVCERGLLTGSGATPESLRANLASLEQALQARLARPAERESWIFRDPQVQLMHDRLDQFLAELDSVIGRREPRERLLLARAALRLSGEVDVTAETEHEAAWERAIRAIRSDPRFNGFDLSRQRGLIPLGPDPRTGLQEFCHVQSGQAPVRDKEGNLVLTPSMAIVLVLLPPARTVVGAQSADRGQPNYDPETERYEGPPIELSIDPFFLAKFELTIAQWCRLSGEARALRLGMFGLPETDLNLLLPVVGIDGLWSKAALAAYSLELPSSINWEYAARAGTSTPWWCGSNVASLQGAGNIADRCWQRRSNWTDADVAGAVPFDDGYPGDLADQPVRQDVAPIARFRPNAFGLHDTLGNVAEWCRDTTIPYMFHIDIVEGSNELLEQANGLQIVRGGVTVPPTPPGRRLVCREDRGDGQASRDSAMAGAA